MRTHRREDHPNTWAQPNDTVHHKDGWAACWMCENERLQELVKFREEQALDRYRDRNKARNRVNDLEMEVERLRAALADCCPEEFDEVASEDKAKPLQGHVHGFSADPPCCRSEDKA